MLSGFVQGGGVNPGPHTLAVGTGGQTDGKGMLHGDLAPFLAGHPLAPVACLSCATTAPSPTLSPPRKTAAPCRASSHPVPRAGAIPPQRSHGDVRHSHVLAPCHF